MPLWPLEKFSWLDYKRLEPKGFNEDGFDEFHRMIGHKSMGLDEHCGFTPAPGSSSNLHDYECLWRLRTITKPGSHGVLVGSTSWSHGRTSGAEISRGSR